VSVGFLLQTTSFLRLILISLHPSKIFLRLSKTFLLQS
jgi:hypothetical protein